jgi:hypothetical protein
MVANRNDLLRAINRVIVWQQHEGDTPEQFALELLTDFALAQSANYADFLFSTELTSEQIKEI